MENVAATFDTMMNYFTNIAGTWRIQDSPVVRFRLFQLRNTDDIGYEVLDSKI